MNLTADITEQSMEKDDGHCTYDTTEPIVDAHSAGANAAIAEVLPLFDPVTRCMGAGPYPRTYHFSSRYSVRANAWGLLALLQRGYDAIGNDNDFFYRGRNFDLATGASLKLSAVLDPAGIAKVRSGCIGTAILPGKPYDSDIAGATEVCDEALAVPEPSFQIEPEGLRLYMDYPYYSMLDGEASELGALIEWSTLEDNITSPVVRTYVNQVTN